MTVLVLEASTTSAKAMVYDKQRGVLAVNTIQYDETVGDIYTQDADAIFDILLETGKKTAEGYDISALALVGAWHSLLCCDRRMEPVGKAYTWANTDAAQVATKLRRDEKFTTHVYESTGCMVHALYPMVKLFYLREKGLLFDDLLFTEIGSYVFYKLTAQRLSTASLWSGSGFYSYNEQNIDSLILEKLGLRREQFGIPATYRDTKPLLADFAKRLGIKAGIPVMPVMPDGGMNQVGSGALKQGIMTLSVGTSSALRISGDTIKVSPKRETWCYLTSDKYLYGAATQGGTSCIDWFADKIMNGRFSYRELEQTIKQSENAPVFLPFLFGERCPGWRDDRTGGFYRLKGDHSYNDMYYAVLEGVLMNIFQCYCALNELSREPAAVVVSGGILNSNIWLQMLSDLLGCEILVSESEQASLLGGAILALHTFGEWPDLTDVPARGTIINPNPKKHDFYRRRNEMYLEQYNLI